MTNRNRNRPTNRPRRTSRRVWVNETLGTALVVNTLTLVDLLSAAQQFMIFDSTILRVLLGPFYFSINLSANQLIREVRYAVFTGPQTLDAADVESLFGDSIGPAYMHVGGLGGLFTAQSQLVTLDLNPDGASVDIKAKRRFRENDQTVWLAVQNVVHASDTTLRIDGWARTLIHVP